MSPNRSRKHLVVLPEDKANQEIVNGFFLHPSLRRNVFQVLSPAGGWTAVLKKFEDSHLPKLRKYKEMRSLLLVDFDRNEQRLDHIKRQIPDDVTKRVFVLGVWSEPEDLKSSLDKRQSLEDLGRVLSNECAEDSSNLWSHELLNR